MPKERILAAGGIVWRDASRRELLLIHRLRYDDWSLPKGKLDPDETFLAAALREVAEETGCAVDVDSFAGETWYRVDGRPKSVLFWNLLATPDAATSIADTDEVAEVVWLPVPDALSRMSYADERELVARNARG